MPNFLPPERVTEIFTAISAGMSLRATASAVGVSKNTVLRYKLLPRQDA